MGLAWVPLWGCLAVSQPVEGPDPMATPTEAQKGVVLISVDGLRPELIRAEVMPFLLGLEAQAAWTVEARTDPEWTLTLPNHFCMLTSRPTEGPDGHGITFNGYADTIVHEARGAYVASAFDVAHDRGLATGFFTGKTKLEVISHAYDRDHGAPDLTGDDHGSAKIDHHNEAPAGDDETLDAVEANLPFPSPFLLFVHLYDTDSTGHGSAFDPSEGSAYTEAARRVDRRLERLVALLEAQPNLQLTFILTSDHGGDRFDHSDPALPVNTRIPFFVWGEGVTAGDLYAKNSGVRDPQEQPIRNCEAGNLALGLLELPFIPGSVFNRDQDLRVR